METNERIAAIAWLGVDKARDEGREGDRKTDQCGRSRREEPTRLTVAWERDQRKSQR